MSFSDNSFSVVKYNTLSSVFKNLEYTDADVRAVEAVSNIIAGRKAFEKRLYTEVTRIVPMNDHTRSLSYLKSDNLILTQGYTSYAGNTYQQGLRLSNAVAIRTDIGHGHTHTFINGISIFATDGSKKLLCRKFYHCTGYSESFIARESVTLLTEYLQSIEPNVPLEDLKSFALSCVKEAYFLTQLNQIDAINNRLGPG